MHRELDGERNGKKGGKIEGQEGWRDEMKSREGRSEGELRGKT